MDLSYVYDLLISIYIYIYIYIYIFIIKRQKDTYDEISSDTVTEKKP